MRLQSQADRVGPNDLGLPRKRQALGPFLPEQLGRHLAPPGTPHAGRRGQQGFWHARSKARHHRPAITPDEEPTSAVRVIRAILPGWLLLVIGIVLASLSMSGWGLAVQIDGEASQIGVSASIHQTKSRCNRQLSRIVCPSFREFPDQPPR